MRHSGRRISIDRTPQEGTSNGYWRCLSCGEDTTRPILEEVNFYDHDGQHDRDWIDRCPNCNSQRLQWRRPEEVEADDAA